MQARGITPLHTSGRARPAGGRVRACILGSTGSIGTNALDVARTYPDQIEVVALGAGENAELLARQILEFKPRIAAVKNHGALVRLKELLGAQEGLPELVAGEADMAALAERSDVDVVLAAIVGFAGLRSVLAAARAGKRIALANKESLVAGGALVEAAVRTNGAEVIPVDSEHSGLFQLLQRQPPETIQRLILTASGGPFLHLPAESFSNINPEQALRHPKWTMGPKNSIDSATMVNKALEVIEAYWLFGVDVEEIHVLVHPQSIVHALIELTDGSQVAQLSVPDMRGPIAYGLRYPDRLPAVMAGLKLDEAGALEFLALDRKKFPAVEVALGALRVGGAAPAIFNIANEIAVEAFLKDRLRFDRIVPFAAEAVERRSRVRCESFEELLAVHAEVRHELEAALQQN